MYIFQFRKKLLRCSRCCWVLTTMHVMRTYMYKLFVSLSILLRSNMFIMFLLFRGLLPLDSIVLYLQWSEEIGKGRSSRLHHSYLRWENNSFKHFQFGYISPTTPLFVQIVHATSIAFHVTTWYESNPQIVGRYPLTFSN